MEPKPKLIRMWSDSRGSGTRYRLVRTGGTPDQPDQPVYVLERAERAAMHDDRWTRVHCYGEGSRGSFDPALVLCIGLEQMADENEQLDAKIEALRGDRLG